MQSGLGFSLGPVGGAGRRNSFVGGVGEWGPSRLRFPDPQHEEWARIMCKAVFRMFFFSGRICPSGRMRETFVGEKMLKCAPLGHPHSTGGGSFFHEPFLAPYSARNIPAIGWSGKNKYAAPTLREVIMPECCGSSDCL